MSFPIAPIICSRESAWERASFSLYPEQHVRVDVTVLHIVPGLMSRDVFSRSDATCSLDIFAVLELLLVFFGVFAAHGDDVKVCGDSQGVGCTDRVT
jgi:hypothetical protein